MTSSQQNEPFSPDFLAWNRLFGLSRIPVIHQLLDSSQNWLHPSFHEHPWAPKGLDLLATQMACQFSMPEAGNRFKNGDPRRFLCGTPSSLVIFFGGVGLLSRVLLRPMAPCDVDNLHQSNPFRLLDIPFHQQDWADEVSEFPMEYPRSHFALQPKLGCVEVLAFTPLEPDPQDDGSIWYRSPYLPPEHEHSKGPACPVISDINDRLVLPEDFF